MIHVYLTASGSGQEYPIGEADDLDSAIELIRALDEEWTRLNKEMTTEELYKFVAVAEAQNHFWAHWEGCDIYARSDGKHWALDTNGEEPEVLKWEEI